MPVRQVLNRRKLLDAQRGLWLLGNCDRRQMRCLRRNLIPDPLLTQHRVWLALHSRP